MKILRAISLSCLSLLPIPTLAQCKDQLCQNLQLILSAAITDFREFRASKTPGPDVSIMGAKVPCQMTAWANNVPMYICYAQVPSASVESWYINTLADLRILQPAWHFEITSPAADHYVDAGPPGCDVPATEGPFLGHCPLHVQAAKQNDGTTKIYLWMSSLSSPYLVKRPPDAPAKSASAVIASGCDDLCQNLKKVFEARLNTFENLRTAKADDGASGASIKLDGANACAVEAAVKSHSNDSGTQYVCYWPEASVSAVETRFRNLIARMEVLVPSNWSIHQGSEVDEFTGAKINAWHAVEPGGKHDIRIYASGESVGLHITSWN